MQLTCADIAFALAIIAVLAASVAGCRGGEPVATPPVAVPTGTPTPAATPTVAVPTGIPTPVATPTVAVPIGIPTPVATPTTVTATEAPTPTATPTRAPGTAPPTPTPVELGPAVVIGDVVLPVELAITPEERRQGLSDRPSLALGTGMLFVFESDGHRQFWMKNMHFPLDMVWIGSDCSVGEISGDVPASSPGADDSDVVRVSPEQEAQYVLEINGGEAAALGLAANDPVSFAGTIAGQYGC